VHFVKRLANYIKYDSNNIEMLGTCMGQVKRHFYVRTHPECANPPTPYQSPTPASYQSLTPLNGKESGALGG